MRLIFVHPEFAATVDPLDGGHFEASIAAPAGSQAGAIIVRTAHKGDIWVHFVPGQMWYPVNDAAEMLKVVDLLLRDKVLFVRTVNAQGEWSGTTLTSRIEDVKVQAGETATVLSWSGLRDGVVQAPVRKPARKRKA
jgi:hypothetical protein